MDLPIENGGSFHSFLCMFTRPGTTEMNHKKWCNEIKKIINMVYDLQKCITTYIKKNRKAYGQDRQWQDINIHKKSNRTWLKTLWLCLCTQCSTKMLNKDLLRPPQNWYTKYNIESQRRVFARAKRVISDFDRFLQVLQAAGRDGYRTSTPLWAVHQVSTRRGSARGAMATTTL